MSTGTTAPWSVHGLNALYQPALTGFTPAMMGDAR